MICPTCQTTNSTNARFCIQCGGTLPRVCPVCGAQNPPNARFCNQCGSLLPSAEPITGTAPQHAATRLITNGAGHESRRAPLPPPVAQRAASSAPLASPATTPSAGASLAEEQAEQRRVVTILFADLTSSTALAEDMDPEDARALLGAFFETMARAIHRHGGTVEKYIGDAVMAVFGLPVAHEDDPLRAVRAALDMQAGLREFNAARRASDANAPELKMRIGVNTGEVAAAGAASEGRDFLITGDPVNVAARLQQLATPGAVFVGPRSYRSTHGAVEYRGLPPATLRGKSRPVKIWEAVALVEPGPAPAARPRGMEDLHAPLVGRESEMELLRAVTTRVLREHRPHLVTLLGVPGIGKTRLAEEYVRGLRGALPVMERVAVSVGGPGTRQEATRTPDMRREREPRTALKVAVLPQPIVLEGRCPPYGEGITYWPLAEMLRCYCDISAFEDHEAARARLLDCVRGALAVAHRPEEPELIATYLGHTIGIESAARRAALLPSESQRMQEGLLRAWRVFFEALAAPAGLVALVEDIHWADESLLDLLEYVVGRASGVPLLVLCTARPELLERRPEWGGGKRNYLTIALEALSGGEMHRLMRELLPGAGVPEHLRQRMLEKAEGNPFYLEETARMLIDRGLLVCDEETNCDGWRVAPEFAESVEISDPAIPDSVQGVLMARIDLLAAAERDVLQHAAVIGRFFWPSALRNLATHLAGEGLESILAALQAKGLIQPSAEARISLAPAGEPIYTFNHALTREIVYSTIVRTRRAHEHARVAEWMERAAEGREEEMASLLAQHYRQYYVQANLARARNSNRRLAVRAKVLRYLTLAGDQAAARHAALKAEAYYSDAIAVLEDDPADEELIHLSDLHGRRGDARWMALRADDAWADYAAALKLWARSPAPQAEDARVLVSVGAGEREMLRDETMSGEMSARGMRLYRQLVLLPARHPGYFHKAPGHEVLSGYLAAGLALAAETNQRDSAEYAALLTAKAFFWWSWPEQRGERELLEALRAAREAVRITEALGEPHGASEALDALGNIQAITTDLRGYLESQARRLHWAERIDDPRELVDIHAEVSQAKMLVGDFPLAVEHARTALTLASAADADHLRMQALRALVLASFEWDHWVEALAAGADLLAASAFVEVRYSHAHLWALLALALAQARTGRRDEAEALVRRVSEHMPGDSTQFIEVMRGRLALARGATREARQIWQAAVEARSGRQALAALLAELAELAARTGDTRLYERYGASALELGWRSGARKALAQAIRARGLVAVSEARWEDAPHDLQNALGRYRELGTAWEEARTRYLLAGFYRRRGQDGDGDLARGELTRALELFERLRAVRDIARVRSALAGGEIRLP